LIPDGKPIAESCSLPRENQNYFGIVSEPLLARIDLPTEVPPERILEMRSAQTGESSAQVREWVFATQKIKARALQKIN
jgi:magnesium chelatase family protein